MDEARRLLEAGKVQEALVLAMDLLRWELDQLRDALEAMREHLPAPAAEGDAIIPKSDWPGPTSQLLH